jgi:hypothetical protein
MATVFEPISPVPPMTTNFMFLSSIVDDWRLLKCFEKRDRLAYPDVKNGRTKCDSGPSRRRAKMP